MGERHKTRQVYIGSVAVGGGASISIQSMTKTPTTDVDMTVAQIERLAEAGCEIIRIAVPTKEAAKALAEIVKASPLPVVADVHFTGDLALRAIDAGVQKIRINPGNMKNRESLARVAKDAIEAKIPVRVGVNSGSVLAGDKIEGDEVELLARTAIEGANFFREQGLEDVVISAKSSSVRSTVEAYRLIAEQTDYPLHVGVTAAGPAECAAIRSSIGIGALLLDGIGDTIRVSVTGDPVREVAIAREILDSLDIRRFGPRIISCPTCGRCEVDLASLANEVREALSKRTEPLTVAVMGCIVNGPGEAREADVGAAFSGSEAWLFKKGVKVRKVARGEVVRELLKEMGE